MILKRTLIIVLMHRETTFAKFVYLFTWKAQTDANKKKTRILRNKWTLRKKQSSVCSLEISLNYYYYYYSYWMDIGEKIWFFLFFEFTYEYKFILWATYFFNRIYQMIPDVLKPKIHFSKGIQSLTYWTAVSN